MPRSSSHRSIPSISVLKFLSSQLLLFSQTNALATIPQTTQDSIPTRTIPPASNISPQHASQITNAPKVNIQKLFGRQNGNICVYANGDEGQPLTCPTGYSCIYLGYSTAFGCCNTITCTNAAHTCVEASDRTHFCNLQVVDCNDLYTSVLTCSGNKPACVTYILRGVLDPQLTYGPQSWTCGTTQTQIYVWETPFSNVPESVTTGDQGSPTAPSFGSSSPMSNTDNNDKEKDNGGKRGLDIGVIIGIVVAVLGVLATVMVGLFPRQMTKCLTCGLRPKKEQSNEEIRRMAWSYFRPGHQSEQSQPLYQGAAPIGLQPMAGQTMLNQPQWQGYTGYEQPPPAYQQQHHYQPGNMPASQYAPTQSWQGQEQAQPFLQHSWKNEPEYWKGP